MEKEKTIQTRLNEVRIKTLEPKKMFNMYLGERVVKKWTEDFVDEDTKEVVSVERTEKLFERGLLIDQDLLAKIQFSIQAGEITEPITVTNQNRVAYEFKDTGAHLWTAKVSVNEKRRKFLLYAQCIEQVIDILRDYIELNYKGGFSIMDVKGFKEFVILKDSLSDPMSEDDLNVAYLKDEIDMATFTNALTHGAQDQNGAAEGQKKYYSLEVVIKYQDTDGREGEYSQDFIVHTFDSERTLLVIKAYLKMQDDKAFKKFTDEGQEYARRTFSLMIEKLQPVNVGCLIPLEFSQAYFEK